MNQTVFLISLLAFCTFVFGYALGVFTDRWNQRIIIDYYDDLAEILRDLEELGFLKYIEESDLIDEATINDIKKLMEEMELSSNDGDVTPQTQED